MPNGKGKISRCFYIPFFLTGILALLALSLVLTRKKHNEMSSFILELESGDEKQEFEFELVEGKKKSVGPLGDVPIKNENLPPIIFTLQRKKGETLIIPQDAISINGRAISGISPVNPGDLIGVRDSIIFKLKERRDESE